MLIHQLLGHPGSPEHAIADNRLPPHLVTDLFRPAPTPTAGRRSPGPEKKGGSGHSKAFATLMSCYFVHLTLMCGLHQFAPLLPSLISLLFPFLLSLDIALLEAREGGKDGIDTGARVLLHFLPTTRHAAVSLLSSESYLSFQFDHLGKPCALSKYCMASFWRVKSLGEDCSSLLAIVRKTYSLKAGGWVQLMMSIFQAHTGPSGLGISQRAR